MVKEIYDETKDRMEKTIHAFKHDLSIMRTGRASIGMLESVKVDYYGGMVPVNQVANISIPEPRLIVIAPWDKSMIDTISKAIMKSDLGLTPSSDGVAIRLSIPQPTEERRKDMVKIIKKKAEDEKVSIRNIRRDQNLAVKEAEDEKLITEDELKKANEKIQHITDEYIKKIEDMLAVKEKEIMEK
ncbi:ribosome recycling factor [Candidatus Desantisbacteria bacterium]|nr:ribosome recycling factor [Candidatus Desantisbacteria bacterium]